MPANSQSNSKTGSKTPGTATIKIAAKDASLRNSTGGADPGPGDLNAAPSVAPELVDLPAAPTPSELVVKSVGKSVGSKSTNSRVIKTINSPPSISGGQVPVSLANSPGSSGGASQKSTGGPGMSVGGSAAGSGSKSGPLTAAPSQLSGGGAAKESTSSKPLSSAKSGVVEGESSKAGLGTQKTSPSGGFSSAGASAAGGSVGAASGQPDKSGAHEESAAAGSGSPTIQTESPAGGASEHDETEEGEGEVEVPEGAPESPAPGGLDGGPSSGGGTAKMSPKTSSLKKAGSQMSGGAGGTGKSGRSLGSVASGTSLGAKPSSAASIDAASAGHHGGGGGGAAGQKKKKKVTKFRYHKRITVRTHGKTSPSAIMSKVSKKDKITPSTIEDMDPQELIKRAGIKTGNKNTHWRVRLRQTKRLTKNGKTTTQTKVAYRDSEGNKRIRTSSSPFCKKCGKKLEDCKCETNSQS